MTWKQETFVHILFFMARYFSDNLEISNSLKQIETSLFHGPNRVNK